jgi:thiol:disulfide interchange protein DsbC
MMSLIPCLSWPRMALMVGLVLALHAHANDALQAVKAGVLANSGGQIQVQTVRATPVAGLFEVTTPGLDLFYVDAQGRHGLIDGRLMDLRERKDLTQARLTELRRIDFAKLPLHLAIKRGNGSRVLAVFEDPTCPVCRSVSRFIEQLPDTTIYHFPFPVVSREALPITATAWCAPDRAEVWMRAMQSGGVPPSPQPTCDIAALQTIVKLGESLKVMGTPTVFLSDGTRLQGAVPPDAFLAALDAASGPATTQPALLGQR